MAFAYFASLSDGRTCYATVEHHRRKGAALGPHCETTRPGADGPWPGRVQRSAGRTHTLKMVRCDTR